MHLRTHIETQLSLKFQWEIRDLRIWVIHTDTTQYILFRDQLFSQLITSRFVWRDAL